MYIISKAKDYYDYLVGKFGLDKTVVYDRRKMTFHPYFRRDYPELFSDYDAEFDKGNLDTFRFINSRRITHNGTITTHTCLEVGNKMFLFERTHKHGEIGDLKLVDTVENCKKNAESVIAIYRYDSWKYESEHRVVKFGLLDKPVENPMLSGTRIASMIPAEEIWTAVYEYLSGLKDISIEDTRTDMQKIESHGFDKKTSFRNM